MAWFREGVAESRGAIALNPESGYSHLQLSMLEALNGRLDEAETRPASRLSFRNGRCQEPKGCSSSAPRPPRYVHYLRGDYYAAYIGYRRELEYVTTSDHALRERTLIELHQKLSALQRARGDQEGRTGSATWPSRRTRGASQRRR